ncbi:MAG: hypothetical protein JW763_06035 [candidate division Zixibacteria bacterium]|nr:hypothetical protein [candidate division Zixibacteria bacterium]
MANAKGSSLSLISLLFSVVILAVVIYMLATTSGGGPARDYAAEKSIAGELTEYNLHRGAIAEYQGILDDPTLDVVTRANINYLIGKIYFNDLFDYENAAAYFVRARSLNPDGSFYDEAGRSLIASLEKMGRVLDAKRELDREANFDSVYAEHEGDPLVAKIGDQPVFLSQLEDELQNMPPEMQKQFTSREGKLAALNKYLSWELIHRAAIREGMDTDPEFIQRQRNLEKQLLLEKYITERIMPEGRIDTADVHNYYLAHKGDRYDDKTYDDVRDTVMRDYQQEKFQQMINEHVNKLGAVDKVQIFEEHLR